MKYVRYQSVGNKVGLEETIDDYWELADDGYVLRSINVKSDSSILKYDEEHLADDFGQLPEGIITEENLKDRTYGKVTYISLSDFEKQWLSQAKNR